MPFDSSLLIGGQLHDVKNQMQSLISVHAELHALLADHPQADELLQQIDHHSQALNQRIVELLSILKIQNKNFSPSIEENWLIDTLDPIIREFTKSHALTLEINVDDDFNPFYDEQLVSLAMRNILTNSEQAGASQVNIWTQEFDNGQWELHVQDNGPGFDSHLLEQTQFAPQGTDHGLGLYLIQQVMLVHKRKQHQGQLILQNHPKGGAHITLVFP
ncbi:sensor histidine kinase [Bermanella sp. R86510]|uniref:sensor histidine kinase n=1 Tax=unclassified Bermanella TaxID=2627862 RepID=UPI0037CB1248